MNQSVFRFHSVSAFQRSQDIIDCSTNEVRFHKSFRGVIRKDHTLILRPCNSVIWNIKPSGEALSKNFCLCKGGQSTNGPGYKVTSKNWWKFCYETTFGGRTLIWTGTQSDGGQGVKAKVQGTDIIAVKVSMEPFSWRRRGTVVLNLAPFLERNRWYQHDSVPRGAASGVLSRVMSDPLDRMHLQEMQEFGTVRNPTVSPAGFLAAVSNSYDVSGEEVTLVEENVRDLEAFLLFVALTLVDVRDGLRPI